MKHRGRASLRERSISPEPREPNNVLLPSSQKVMTADNVRTELSHDDDKELATKASTQNTNDYTDVHDENQPASFQPYVDPTVCTEVALDGLDRPVLSQGCAGNQSPTQQDASYSFVLVNRSAEAVESQNTEEVTEAASSANASSVGEHGEVAETTTSSPEPLSFTSNVECDIPLCSSSGEEQPCSAGLLVTAEPSILDPDTLCPQPLQRSFPTMSPSVQTSGLLSDIVEAEEPNASDVSSQIQEDPTVTRANEAIAKAVLSFSSFGSSFASTDLAETSLIRHAPEAAPSNTSHPDEPQQGDIIVPPPSEDADRHTMASRSPVLSHPSPLSPPVVSALIPEERPPSPLPIQEPASRQQFSPIHPVLSTSFALDVPATQDDPTPSGGERTTAIPVILAPSTYADAMNLALQYPEMSSKLLKEPLASDSRSNCATPTRAASPMPSRSQAGSAGPAHTNDRPNWSAAPTHTSDRPNWATAPSEPQPARRPRSRGNSNARRESGSTCPNNEQGRGGKRNDPGHSTSRTPPVATPNLPLRPLAPTPRSRQSSPEKRPTRHLRKEKAEPWLHRVNSWVEQTSNTAQASPNVQGTPATSPGISPTLALSAAASESAKMAALPNPTTSTSPLNPEAPAWEFQPRQRATTARPAKQPSNVASPWVDSPASRASQNAFNRGLEADLQRLRTMLRECGLESELLESHAPAQQRSIWSLPENSQAIDHLAPPQNVLAANTDHGLHNITVPHSSPIGTASNSLRQRTKTHAPLGQTSLQEESPGCSQVPSDSRDEPAADSVTMLAGRTPCFNVLPPLRYVPALSPLSKLRSDAAAAIPVPRTPDVFYETTAPPPAVPAQPRPVVSQPTDQATRGGFEFVQSRRHTTDIASIPGPPLPPGSGRTRPQADNVGAIPTAAPARFYGIQTPRIIHDKHGWTVFP